MDNPLPEELLKKIWMDVDNFQKGTKQFDDITMRALTYRNNGFRERTYELLNNTSVLFGLKDETLDAGVKIFAGEISLEDLYKSYYQ